LEKIRKSGSYPQCGNTKIRQSEKSAVAQIRETVRRSTGKISKVVKAFLSGFGIGHDVKVSQTARRANRGIL